MDDALLHAALAARAGGLSIIPTSDRDKRPLCALLPVDGQGKPVWKPFQESIAPEDAVRGWFARGLRSIAAVGGRVSGGLLVLDFDVARFYDAWRERVGDLADGLAVQRTGRDGGGYQVWLRCPDPGESRKLAWVADEAEDAGRRAAVETKGEGGYAVMAPSLHPSGRRYEMIAGDFANVPTVSQARADALIAAARKLDEAPFTRQELAQRAAAERQALEAHLSRRRATANGSASVIDAFNCGHDIGAIVRRYGYTPGAGGGRYVRPGGESPSVNVKDGRSCHWSTDDPLNDGKVRSGMGVHDAFDVFCHYEHGGDSTKAVRTAAELLGMSTAARQRLDQAGRVDVDQTPAGGIAGGVSSTATRATAGVSATPYGAPAPKKARPRPVPPYRPFPTGVLPYPLARFVRETAAAMGCDESFVALPLLVGLAGAVGNAAEVRVTADWSEPCVLWAAVVAGSGERKSPPFYAALRPLRDMQRAAVERYKAEALQYKRDVIDYKNALTTYKLETMAGGGGTGGPPEEPVRPVLKRFLVIDTTVEALVARLEDNPRGVALARDELSAWFGGFNQYKAGGKGGDGAHWLEMHRAGTVAVDRKTGDRQLVYVDRAAVSIAGTIQPRVLARCLGSEHFDSGMAARFLFAMPPSRQRVWSDARVGADTREQVAGIYARLAGLPFDPDRGPAPVPLTAEAQAMYVEFVNRHGREQARLESDDLKAAWSKLEGGAARLALLFHLVRLASGDPSLDDADAVDDASLAAGVTLAEWRADVGPAAELARGVKAALDAQSQVVQKSAK